MSALCAKELRCDQQWDRIRRDPELLATVLEANRPKLMSVVKATQQALAKQPIRAAVMAGFVRLDTTENEE